MRLEICDYSKLSPTIAGLWRHWHASNPRSQTPFTHPTFAAAVDRTAKNVEVAIAYDEEVPVAVLPFQRSAVNRAEPVGGYLSNHQGWIAKEGCRINLSHFIAQPQIRSFRFHMLPVEDMPTTRFLALRRSVVHADLSDGFDAYAAKKREAGCNVVAKLAQKERKIAREIGPLHLEIGSTEEAFEALLNWKRMACENRNVQNILDSPHAQATLANLLDSNDPEVTVHFSRLMAGDRLVAVHLGMICHGRLAAWFLAFDPEFGIYSPGLLMLLQLIRQSERWGVHRIDFGNGEFSFKDRFKTGESIMLEGIVDKNFAGALMHGGWLKARDWAKSNPFHPTIQRVWNYIRS